MRHDYDHKIADHAFAAIQFLLGLFVQIFALYFTIFATFIAFQTSEFSKESPSNDMKTLAVVLSGFVLIYMWATWYLIVRGSREYQKRLENISPIDSSRRLSHARDKLLLVGTVLAIAGTAVIGMISVIVTKL